MCNSERRTTGTGTRRRRLFRPAAALTAGLLALTVGCRAPDPTGTLRLTPEQRRLNLASFDAVWRTVRDKHWDPKLAGLDWDGVYAELRPQVEQAATMAAARETIQAALRRLNLSHFGILPRDIYARMESGPGPQDGDPGLSVRIIDGWALVTAVQPGSPAAQAGVRAGWQLARIGDTTVAPLVQRIAIACVDSTQQDLILTNALRGRLRGPAGSTVEVEFLNERDEPVTLELPRAPLEGQLARLGHLPPVYLTFESRALDDDIGYIAFNLFFDPDRLMSQVEHALRSFWNAPGLVIDLRGNMGGLGGLAMGLAGWFVEHTDQPLGIMRTRDSELRFAIFPRPQVYTRPLAILVDGVTASTAEMFAGGLQDLGRARVFGQPTAGAALPSMIERLPNGDGFQYAIADYVTAKGRRLEGAGVTPDEEIVPTREQLLAGRDPVLAAAIRWIRAHGGATTQAHVTRASASRRAAQSFPDQL